MRSALIGMGLVALSFHGRKVIVEQGSNPPRALERALDELAPLASSLPRK